MTIHKTLYDTVTVKQINFISSLVTYSVSQIHSCSLIYFNFDADRNSWNRIKVSIVSPWPVLCHCVSVFLETLILKFTINKRMSFIVCSWKVLHFLMALISFVSAQYGVKVKITWFCMLEIENLLDMDKVHFLYTGWIWARTMERSGYTPAEMFTLYIFNKKCLDFFETTKYYGRMTEQNFDMNSSGSFILLSNYTSMSIQEFLVSFSCICKTKIFRKNFTRILSTCGATMSEF